MNTNRFVRSFVLLTTKHLNPPKPKLKDLYIGQKDGKLMKPWVLALASINTAATLA
jgi:hypothetical protein